VPAAKRDGRILGAVKSSEALAIKWVSDSRRPPTQVETIAASEWQALHGGGRRFDVDRRAVQ
jgi:hypothetical protein